MPAVENSIGSAWKSPGSKAEYADFERKTREERSLPLREREEVQTMLRPGKNHG